MYLRTAVAAALLAAASALPVAHAAEIETTPAVNAVDRDFAAGKKAVEAKRWKDAVGYFNKVVARDSKNADAYNMLGYSYRWLDQMDESFAAYGRALALDPNHRGANEYIGKAYLKVGNVAKAEEHLARLQAICGANCAEYRDLAGAIAQQKAKQ
jgi:Flp pilus assembly protein TadD